MAPWSASSLSKLNSSPYERNRPFSSPDKFCLPRSCVSIFQLTASVHRSSPPGFSLCLLGQDCWEAWRRRGLAFPSPMQKMQRHFFVNSFVSYICNKTNNLNTRCRRFDLSFEKAYVQMNIANVESLCHLSLPCAFPTSPQKPYIAYIET